MKKQIKVEIEVEYKKTKYCDENCFFLIKNQFAYIREYFCRAYSQYKKAKLPLKLKEKQSLLFSAGRVLRCSECLQNEIKE